MDKQINFLDNSYEDFLKDIKEFKESAQLLDNLAGEFPLSVGDLLSVLQSRLTLLKKTYSKLK